MLWYKRSPILPVRTAEKPAEKSRRPPAYMEERISDLEHAQEFFYKDPGRARKILATVSEQIDQHHDDDFLDPIKTATEMLRQGSPAKAFAVIEATKKAMREEFEMKELEDRNPWKKPKS